MIFLDYRDKRPIYEQVVEKLERLIASGGLEPLTKMPSVRSLAMELSVNPNTVQRAYTQLEQDGYLYTVSGRGSFVTAENEWKESRQKKVVALWKEVTAQAKEIGLTEAELSRHLHRIYSETISEGGGEGKVLAAEKATTEGNAITEGSIPAEGNASTEGSIPVEEKASAEGGNND